MKALARLVAVLGAVAVGWFLLSARPKDVVLVYDVSGTPGASSLDVDIRRGPEFIRHAELRVPRGAGEVWHSVKLQEGEYTIAWRISEPGRTLAGERPLEIHEDGTIVLPLAR